LKINGLNAEPDYYLRNGKRIFLFESKDVLIKAEIKSSYDYNLMSKEIHKKFVSDNNGSKPQNKAILQLINSIKSIYKKQIPNDSNYSLKNVLIYPIIITHNNQSDTVGLNKIIQELFEKELEKNDFHGFKKGQIEPITIINIDTLIFYQDIIGKQVKLEELINNYHKYTSTVQGKKFKSQEEMEIYFEKSLIPFSFFVENYMLKKGYNSIPKFMKEVGLEINI
jgi:hypothetical protein